MRRIPFLSWLCVLCVALAFCGLGCTQSQSAAVQNGLNELNAAVISPLADQTGTTGIAPYVRLLFSNIRTLGYTAIDVVTRLTSPNAGEPIAPATQPASGS